MSSSSREGIRFEFATAGRILFGNGRVREAGVLARAELGERALVVTGETGRHARPLLDSLAEHGVATEQFAVRGEPTTATVREGCHQARKAACDCVIGIGGGSAIDAAKAMAALLTNGGDPLDYLEVVGRGMPLARPAAPWMAIPTPTAVGKIRAQA